MSNPVSVFIVDDCDVVKFGLCAALKHDPGFQVVGEAGCGKSAVEKIRELNPEIVLLDWFLPDITGMEVLKQVRETNPDIKWIVLTVKDEPEAVSEALATGADGFCSKGVRMEWLNAGIKTVAAGGKWLGPKIVERLMQCVPSNAVAAPRPEFNAAALQRGPISVREQQVLDLLVQGMSNNQIAERLFLSPETVKTHLRHIMEKLSVRDRTHAAVEAIRRGLVSAC